MQQLTFWPKVQQSKSPFTPTSHPVACGPGWAAGPLQALVNIRQDSAWNQACTWQPRWTMGGEGHWGTGLVQKKKHTPPLHLFSFLKLCFLWPHRLLPILSIWWSLCLESPSHPCVHGNNIHLIASSPPWPQCPGQGQTQSGSSVLHTGIKEFVEGIKESVGELQSHPWRFTHNAFPIQQRALLAGAL